MRNGGPTGPPFRFGTYRLASLDDLAGLDAGGADPQALGGAAHQGAHALDVGIPPALGDVVGVGDIVPELGLLTANFALTRHGNLTNQR